MASFSRIITVAAAISTVFRLYSGAHNNHHTGGVYHYLIVQRHALYNYIFGGFRQTDRRDVVQAVPRVLTSTV